MQGKEIAERPIEVETTELRAPTIWGRLRLWFWIAAYAYTAVMVVIELLH